MPVQDLVLSDTWGKQNAAPGQLRCHEDGCDEDAKTALRRPSAILNYCAKNDLSFTTATDSVTLDDSLASSPRVRELPPRPPVPQASPSFLTDPLSLQVPTMHRALTIGGTHPLIVLDPHLIAIDRLGPASLEAKGIEIVSRPSCYYIHVPPQQHAVDACNKGSSSSNNNITPMIPRFIRIRHELKPILRRTDELSALAYQPPAPIKRVRFQIIKHPGVTEDTIIADNDENYKRIDVLTEKDMLALWWTRGELKKMENREWCAVRKFVRSTPHFAEAFERVLIECFKNIEKDHKLSRVQLQPHGGLGLTLDEALQVMTCHDFRGLERSMVHWLSVSTAKHYFQIRSKCSAALMKAQSRWKNVDEPREVKEQKIASCVRNYSLFAEKLAQLVAQGDAAMADRVLDDESDAALCPIVLSEVLRASAPRGRVVI